MPTSIHLLDIHLLSSVSLSRRFGVEGDDSSQTRFS